jgi:seryl-tRNA synthetase
MKTWMPGPRPGMTVWKKAMHDVRWIRENPEAFDKGLVRRGLAPMATRIVGLDAIWREKILQLEAAQARRNSLSQEVGIAKKQKNEKKAQSLLAEVMALKEPIASLVSEERKLSNDLVNVLADIPNLPLDDVPEGKDSDDNVEHHCFGAKRDYAFAPKQHFELGEALRQMDFETAAKLSGARFVVLKQGLARLERALGQFMLDVHTNEHGYKEVAPPLLVLDGVMFGTGQLWKFRDDQFATFTDEFRWKMLEDYARSAMREVLQIAEQEGIEVAKTKIDTPFVRQNAYIPERHWLIPTAEVPLTNLVRESIVDEAQLPMRLTACTPCFRAEAGAAGKDTRGMIRQHQFTKVELVSITTPEQSRDEHERMLACAEEVLRRLDLHYRVVTLSTGDMGFAAQKTYDIEVWLPGQNMYREISSCSVCGDFQARRMNARFRGKDRNVRHVHTLNGSGVAVGRALIAVMETYQESDGSIAVPDVLQTYMGGMTKIEKGE